MSQGTLREVTDESYFEIIYSVDKSENTVSKEIIFRDGESIITSIPIHHHKINETPIDVFDYSYLREDIKRKGVETRGVLRVCDLFSGCGGISSGLEAAANALGFQVEFVLAWDIMEASKIAYELNFSPKYFMDSPIENTIDGELGEPITPSEKEFLDRIGRIDFVVGGPPCQGHSDLNNHSRRDDPKNDLYLRMTRFIEITNPGFAIIENVLTVRRSKSQVTQLTNEFLGKTGFSIEQGAIRGIDIGIAQDRRRHFSVIVRDNEVPRGIFKTKRIPQPRPVLWAINDLGDVDPASIYNHPSTHQKQNVERIAWLFGDDWTDEEKDNEEFNFGTKKKPFSYNLINPRRPKCHQNGHNYPAVYGRMFPNLPAPTITCGFGSTGQGRFVHPNYRRTLTPHEAARVQSFPDKFIFPEEVKRRAMHMLIGNAVPPLMAEFISLRMLSTIR